MPNNSNTGNELAKKNEKKMRDFYDKVINAHNIEMVDSFVAADFIDHQPDPRYPPTIEGLKSGFKDFFAAYPDLHTNIDFVMVNGDTIMAEYSLTGTNSGPMMGMPPTNKQINIEGVDIVRIVNDKAVEHWGFVEEGKMMTQLGLMPPPGAMNDTSKMKMEEKPKQ